jgi:hypothetical protein
MSLQLSDSVLLAMDLPRFEKCHLVEAKFHLLEVFHVNGIEFEHASTGQKMKNKGSVPFGSGRRIMPSGGASKLRESTIAVCNAKLWRAGEPKAPAYDGVRVWKNKGSVRLVFSFLFTYSRNVPCLLRIHPCNELGLSFDPMVACCL